jgi:hypothetical protein
MNCIVTRLPLSERRVDQGEFSRAMTTGELRALIADVPDDVPVALRVAQNGCDALATVTVRAVGPRREPSLRRGVLTDDEVDFVSRRRHLVLAATDMRDGIQARLDSAGLDGWFDPDDGAWCTFGWSDERFGFGETSHSDAVHVTP